MFILLSHLALKVNLCNLGKKFVLGKLSLQIILVDSLTIWPEVLNVFLYSFHVNGFRTSYIRSSCK